MRIALVQQRATNDKAANRARGLEALERAAVDEWPEGLFEAEMRTAALQNGYFTALCNRVGREPKLEFAGESFVCDPEGKVIARAGRGAEEILLCDLDLDMVQRSHARRSFLRCRRPELYGDWLK